MFSFKYSEVQIDDFVGSISNSKPSELFSGNITILPKIISYL